MLKKLTLEIRMTKTTVFAGFLLVFLVGLISPVAAQDQDGQSPLRGFQPNGSYALSDVESVSLSGGNLSYSLPLASLPPSRGGRLKPVVYLLYNSKLFDTQVRMCLGPSCTFPAQRYVQTDLVHSAFGGWTYGTNCFVLTRNRSVNYVDGAPPPWNTFKFRTELYFPDGSSHQLRPSDQAPTDEYYSVSPGSPGTTRMYYTTDGSYLRVEFSADGASWTIYCPDGSTVNYDNSTGIQRTTDGNGNFYTTQNVTLPNGNPATVVTDQVNRKITVEKPVSGPHYVRVNGFGGTEVVTAINWATKSPQGKKWLWKEFLDQGTYTFKTLVPQRPVVTSIELPNGLSYQFQYNSEIFDPLNPTKSVGWGELYRVTLPSGATTQYAYSMDNRHGDENADIIEPKFVLWNHPTSKQLTYTEKHDGVNTSRTDNWSYSLNVIGGGPAEGQIENASTSSPDGGVTSEYFFVNLTGSTSFGRAGMSYKTIRPDGSRVERFWQDNVPYNGSGKTKNSYVKTEFISIPNSAGTLLVQTAIKDYTYDKNGNVTQVAEYDWVAYGDVARDAVDNPTGAIPPSAQLKRVTAVGFYNQTPSADSLAFNASIYNLSTAPNLRRATQWQETRSGFTQGSAVSRVEFDYDDPGSKGNLAAQRAWSSAKGAYSNPLTSSNSVSSSTQYNQYGSPMLITDVRLVQTQVIYDATDLYPTQVKTAFQTSVQRTESHEYDFSTGLVTRVTDVYNNVSTATTYDVFGRPVLVKGAEGKPEETRTSIEYSDALRRVITRSDLNVVGDGKLVSIAHYDQLGRLRLKQQLEDAATESATDETTGIKVQTRYLVSGDNSYLLTSNPYRTATSGDASGETTMGWTRAKSDQSGRVIEIQTFGGTSLPAPWGPSTTSTSTGAVTTAYDANFTTVTDQAGKVRRSMMDALGRLTRVDEPDATGNLGATNTPVQPTNYAYDRSDNLTTVTQGSQVRTFSYDSLSRLLIAVNPESGTISYRYDDGGNLIVKTDARGVSAHSEYDALNRVTRRWYNGSNLPTSTTHNSPALQTEVGATNEAKFYYDMQSLPTGAPSYTRGSAIGRLVAQTYGPGSNGDYYAYDVRGRQTLKFQQVGSVNYQLSASYSLSGAISTLTYPSGHTVTNTYDNAGRLTGLAGNLGDGTTRTYATGILYSPLGALVKEQFGTTPTAVYNKLFYNSRGQLAEIRASTSYIGPSDKTWDRGAILNNYSTLCTGDCSGSSMSDDNGNLLKQQIYIPGQTMRYQEYLYDSLNRLDQAREVLDGGAEQWKQKFTYDRWGNRTINTALTYGIGINDKAFDINAVNNRLTVPSGQSGVMQYDAAGNLTNDTYTGAGNRTYDAENKITSAWGGNNHAQLYGYDGSGQRIQRAVNGIQTWQVYGFGGELLAEYPANGSAASPQKEYGYRNGQLLITAEPVSARPVNVALASNGATVTASSAYSGFAASGAINGDRRGLFLGQNGYWSTASAGFPAWLEVQFNGSKTISEIDVITPQDNYQAPIEPTESMTFTLGGLSGYEVQYWNGSAWMTVPGGNVSGNNKVWKKFSFAPITTTKIRVLASASPDNYSRLTELEAWTGPSPAPCYNLALVSMGAVATASNSANAGYGPAGANNGDRKSLNWTNGGGWNDSGPPFPDWLQIDFGSVKTINEVDVFTLQDNWANSAEPTESMTFTLWGLTSYQVEYWDGTNWIQIPGASVTGNNKVWRKFTFSPIATSKIRVVTNASVDGYSRITEVEAYGPADVGGSGNGVQWLVSDHLGTPRMIFDETGNLANMTHHDYLPFGEELFAPTAGRTVAMGYAGGDGVRQQFTLKERDIETGLDYFEARCYSSSQGRFMTPDLPLVDQRLDEPQSWNLYSYVVNNPHRYIDPYGYWKWTREGFVIWETNDTWESLGALVGADPKALEEFFQGVALGPDTALDITNFNNSRGSDQKLNVEWTEFDEREFQLTLTRADLLQMGNSIEFVPPVGGGLRTVTAAEYLAISRAAGASRILRQNLLEAGAIASEGQAAHHIVAAAARPASFARSVLARFGININTAENGLFLEASVHARIHTAAYYRAVNRLLSQAQTREEALAVLEYIKSEIAKGTFP